MEIKKKDMFTWSENQEIIYFVNREIRFAETPMSYVLDKQTYIKRLKLLNRIKEKIGILTN